MLQEASGTTGASTRRYHYGKQALQVTDPAGTTFLSVDALGSTTDQTTTAGTVYQARKYDAWGQYRNGTAPAANQPKLGYTGHQYDPETGLTYARARYYDADAGVFLSRDSYEGRLEEAPSLHRYAYAWGNPLRYWDLFGFDVGQAERHRQEEEDYVEVGALNQAAQETGAEPGSERYKALARQRSFGVPRTPEEIDQACRAGDSSACGGGAVMGAIEGLGRATSGLVAGTVQAAWGLAKAGAKFSFGSSPTAPFEVIEDAKTGFSRAFQAGKHHLHLLKMGILQPEDVAEGVKVAGVRAATRTTVEATAEAAFVVGGGAALASKAKALVRRARAADAPALGTEVSSQGSARAAGEGGSSQGLPPLRQAYADSVAELAEMVPSLRMSGATPEAVARALHAERRVIGIQFKAMTPPEVLEKIHARNMAKYGDELGPSIEWLRAHGKSWDEIIDSATRTGGKDLGF